MLKYFIDNSGSKNYRFSPNDSIPATNVLKTRQPRYSVGKQKLQKSVGLKNKSKSQGKLNLIVLKKQYKYR